MYTQLACRVHKPVYFPGSPSSVFSQPLISHVARVSITSPTKTGAVGDPSYLFIPNATYEDPETRKKCATDPDVQAKVARLSATLSTTMGILSCLVTGWWGSFCDRYGRRVGLVASIVGLLLTELVFIITANFVDYLPGNYWFLLTGFVIEGLLGSMPAGFAANHAYVADTTDPPSRSRMFSLALGLIFVGFAVGPLIGGVTIRMTGSTLSVFYLAATLHSIYILLLVFVLPESLTKVRAHNARLRHKAEKEMNMGASTGSRILKDVTRFLDAMAVLRPRDTIDGNPLRRHKKDWSLFLVAICYATSTSVVSMLPFVLQYGVATFAWSSETANYYVASGGVSRALVLVVLVPLTIKYLKGSKAGHTDTVRDLDEPHQETPFNSSHTDSRSRSRSQQSLIRKLSSTPTQSFKVDVILARGALAIEICGYLLMAATTSEVLFVIGTIMGSASVAVPPICQAVAVEIYSSADTTGMGTDVRRGQGEVGRLFGAMSVLQALATQIIGPAVYGFVYSRTVATFPQAIMLVSASSFTVASILLALVKVPSGGPVLGRDTEDGEGVDDGESEGVRGLLVNVAEGRVVS